MSAVNFLLTNLKATEDIVQPITGTPTGAVTFYKVTALGPSRTSLWTPQSLVPLLSGQAVFTSTTLSAGTHTIVASYRGDGGFFGSTAPALTQVVNCAAYRYVFPLIFG